MSIGQRIKQERERLGHTQDDWARAAGIHRNTQVKYEKDESVPSIEYLTAVDGLGADADFVRTGKPTQTGAFLHNLDLDCEFVFDIVKAIETRAAEKQLHLSIDKKARAVAMLYRTYYSVEGRRTVDPEIVNDVVGLAAR